MLILWIIPLLLGIILNIISHILMNRNSFTQKLAHRILKQVMITFTLFNIFNVTFSTVIDRIFST